MKTFRDPSTSSARHTKTLFIRRHEAVTGVNGWMGGFSRVVHLRLIGKDGFPNKPVTLAPFLGFSPVLESLLVESTSIPTSQLFDLTLSFPLLKNLTAIKCHDVPAEEVNVPAGLLTAIQPRSPPMTGSLTINQENGMGSIVRRLLSLPGGIHFRRVSLRLCGGEDDLLATALVKECSHTLESLELLCGFHGTPTLYSCLHRRPISVSRIREIRFD